MQALAALHEAVKYVVKASGVPNKDEKLNSLDNRIRFHDIF